MEYWVEFIVFGKLKHNYFIILLGLFLVISGQVVEDSNIKVISPMLINVYTFISLFKNKSINALVLDRSLSRHVDMWGKFRSSDND